MIRIAHEMLTAIWNMITRCIFGGAELSPVVSVMDGFRSIGFANTLTLVDYERRLRIAQAPTSVDGA